MSESRSISAVSSASSNSGPRAMILPFGSITADAPGNVDFYTSAAVQYPWAADAFFMFPAAFYRNPREPMDGPLDIRFAVSRDGLRWHRPDRGPFIRLGPEGAWDSASLYAGYGLTRTGDTLYLYYTGQHVTHGQSESVPRLGVVTRAALRIYMGRGAVWQRPGHARISGAHQSPPSTRVIAHPRRPGAGPAPGSNPPDR